MGAVFYPDVDFKTLFIPHIFQEIYINGIYNSIFDTREPNSMTILDVGANIGLVTQFMQPYAKKLYAIEPAGDSFACLQKNKEYNHWDNVEIFQLAIANSAGEAILYKNKQNTTSHSLVTAYGGEEERVAAVSFEKFFDEYGIETVDFLKLDVEGAEHFILQGDGFQNVAHRIMAMVVEFHFLDWPDIVEKIVKLGFHADRKNCSAIVVEFTR